MGKPTGSHVPVSFSELNRRRRRTGRSETSQYPQEEKTKVILLVVVSEKGTAQTDRLVKPTGVFRSVLWGLVGAYCGMLEKLQIHSLVERSGKSGSRG